MDCPSRPGKICSRRKRIDQWRNWRFRPLAIQIAKHFGAATVIVTGRNAQSVQGLAELGADLAIPLDAPADELKDTFREAMHTHKVSVVLDYLWGPSAECLLNAAAGQGHNSGEPRIRFVQIGSMTGNNINLPGSLLRSSGLELMGSGLGSVSNAGLVQAVGGVYGQSAAPACRLPPKR